MGEFSSFQELHPPFNYIADQDIKYGDLSVGAEDDYIDYYYTDDDTFADIMDTFLYIMARAKKSGGLYCDGVVSKAETYN